MNHAILIQTVGKCHDFEFTLSFYRQKAQSTINPMDFHSKCCILVSVGCRSFHSESTRQHNGGHEPHMTCQHVPDR